MLGERAACVVRALAEAQGLTVSDGDEDVELIVMEVASADELLRRKSEQPDADRPLIAVVRRRLRDGEAKALAAAGASAVIDAESSILDVAFVLSDLLFGTRQKLRQYSRVHGGTPVRLRTLSSHPEVRASGQLVDLSRPGAFVLTGEYLAEGTAVEMELKILGRLVSLRGRVAYARAGDEHREGMAIEFALGECEVAPKLFAVCDEAVPMLEPRERSNSTATLSSARSA